MGWTLTDHQLAAKELLNAESLFSLGNGYLGVRGNFEEGYGDGMQSIRGTYQNAFHDVIDIPYGEKLYGFPDTQQKLVNVIDAQTIDIFLGAEMERFSLFSGKIKSYERSFHLDQGFSERMIHWQSPNGKEVKLHFRRLVAFQTRELFVIDVQIEPVNYFGEVTVVSTVNGDVTNFVDPHDPRVASGHAKRLHVEQAGIEGDFVYVAARTETSQLETACVTKHVISANHDRSVKQTDSSVTTTFTFSLNESVGLTKWNVYTDTLRHKQNLVRTGKQLHAALNRSTFAEQLKQQQQYLADYWKNADITIAGDVTLQEGIRFNLFHLLQSVGRDEYSNISAKGLSGEGYEGHYFWDTEIYMFPVFLMTKPDIARQLLVYRYSILDAARARAKEMGHKKGALFPWRTISGGESSSYFPAGTAQYHISADIAYSYIQYFLATNDRSFLEQYGAEVLYETARLWLDIGHFYKGTFRIDDVTGPDEYTAIVNNNYYTNVMAKYNLTWAVKVYELLGATAGNVNVTQAEVLEWQKAAEQMYLPYDEELDINAQDDSFLQKAVWDFAGTPAEHYPLLLHYHPLTLYRYQVCKQADAVLAHFLLEDETDASTIKHSYDYYETITTHDSSLSSCVFSIMAAKVGYKQKAYEYFSETARLDLDNTHGNTKDGLHMANMGGTWLAIVYGFAGVRLKEAGLSLAPILPENWDAYAFKLLYQDSQLHIEIKQSDITISLLVGDRAQLKLFDEPISVMKDQPYVKKYSRLRR